MFNFYIVCQNCNKRFYKEDDLITHYQICFNSGVYQRQAQELINMVHTNNVASLLGSNTETNPFLPDNLNEYVDWELIKNKDTGVNLWIHKGLQKPTGKYLLFLK